MGDRRQGDEVVQDAGQIGRICALTVLGLCSFGFVVVGGVTGGVGLALAFLGLPLFVVGLTALVAGRTTWLFRASRRAGALACVAGLALFALGTMPPGASDDIEQVSAPTRSLEPATDVPAETPSPPPSPPAPSPDSATAPPADDAVAPPPSSALAVLATLEVKGRAPKTGYDRDAFGQRWADTDRNGCDTRNDTLRRDLTAIDRKPGTNGCVVLAGRLADPFSGTTIAFVRGQDTSADVQIDHVVALSDAWQKGAQQWSPERRLAFANDPLNLLAVDGGLNAQKGDGDAATWLPPNRAFRCAYVARQVAVKAKYGSWVTEAERDAVARVLGDCPGEKVPSSDAPPEAPIAAPPPPPKAAPPSPPVPEPTAAGSCDPAYPGVCIPPPVDIGDLDCGDVDARGFVVLAPDPHRFDGNHDGVGCES